GPVAAAEAQTSTNPRSAPVAAAPPPPAPPLPAAKPTSTSVGATEPRSAAGPARVPAPAPPHAGANASNGNHSFLDLPGDHYVIELAHSEREADADAARAALHLPRGEVYELHLRQNGTDAWLLVWGSFDDVGAARAARGELPADVHAGWPRRVSPLQAEVRRAEQP
ncbi:MAG: hypothetical protein P4L92_21185, partial [Rudaea sp.]|nr:hypothetical protein [Rudaea sp.]